MAYRTEHVPEYPSRGDRDGIYPSEVAKDRPIGLTKVDCGPNPEHTGDESACERMNRQLRDQPLRGERG